MIAFCAIVAVVLAFVMGFIKSKVIGFIVRVLLFTLLLTGGVLIILKAKGVI